MDSQRRSQYSVLFAFLLAPLLAVGTTSAERADRGSLASGDVAASFSGIVVSRGAPVANARVTEASTGESALTDFRGRFVLSGFPVGPTILSIVTEGGVSQVPFTANPGRRLFGVVSLGAAARGPLAAILLKVAQRGHSGDEIRGSVTAINGSTVTVQDQILSNVNLKTTSKTLFRHGSSMLRIASLVVNMTVQAKATLQRDGTFLADEIDVEDESGDESISGTVKSFDCDLGSMILTTDSGDVTVTFDVNTVFESKDQPASCSDLGVGDDAEVEGTVQGDGSVLASKVGFEPPETEEVEVQGTVKSVSDPSFVVTTESGDVTVTTDGNTAFEKCDNPASFTDVAVDAVVEAKGTLQNDGSVLASKVSIECEGGGQDSEGGD